MQNLVILNLRYGSEDKFKFKVQYIDCPSAEVAKHLVESLSAVYGVTAELGVRIFHPKGSTVLPIEALREAYFNYCEDFKDLPQAE